MKLHSTMLVAALGLGLGCAAPVEGDGQNDGALTGSPTTLRTDRFSIAGAMSRSSSSAAPKATPSAPASISSGVSAIFANPAAAVTNVQGTWGLPPPPEGPPRAAPNAAHSLSVPVLVSLANGAVQGAVSEANAKTSRYSVSVSYDTSSPTMLSTQFEDRPNEFYANIPFNLTYSIFLNPVGPSLTITQSTNIPVSCEGWQTGSGTVTERIVFEPAYFDPEQYNNLITGAVQAQIQSAVNALPLGSRTLWSGTPCGTLGAYTNAQDGDSGDEIVFDDPVATRPSLVPPISVSVLQVRRLSADQGGTPEYEAVETPYLQLWTNEAFFSLSLPPMAEGQTFVPTNAVVQTKPLEDQLVVIANMQYSGFELPIGQVDATFAAFGRTSSFGNGTIALQTPKSWTVVGPTPPGGDKPNVISVTTAGYEVTLQISVPPELILTTAVAR
jgi:hypothetical protein